jgi:hypothetical protein
VFSNDNLVAELLAVRIDMSRRLDFSNPQVRPAEHAALLRMLGSGHNDVLYIEVGHAEAQRVVFGPIDGGAT